MQRGYAIVSGGIQRGEVAEWFKAAVLKTVEVERLPGVRIPSSPPPSLALARSGGGAERLPASRGSLRAPRLGTNPPVAGRPLRSRSLRRRSGTASGIARFASRTATRHESPVAGRPLRSRSLTRAHRS